MRFYNVTFLYDIESWRDDQQLENALASWLSAHQLEAVRVAGKGNYFSISRMKKATPETDSLTGVKKLFDKIRDEEWKPLKTHQEVKE